MEDDSAPRDIEAELDAEEDEQKKRAPLMELAEWQFLLTLPDDLYDAVKKQSIRKQLMDRVQADSMAPYYQHLCEHFNWPLDNDLLQKMKTTNENELKAIEEKIQDAKANLGDIEVQKAYLAKAEIFARIGDRERTVPAYNETLEKTVGSGGRIDLVLAVIRVGLFQNDMDLVRTYIEKAETMIEEGGDWERRNLLKIYKAANFIIHRDFKAAATLLLESVATFTCYELFDYNTFIFYTIICTYAAMDRRVIGDKVIHNPDILSVYRDIPLLPEYIQSLYKCRYADFFRVLASISDYVKRDRFLAPHFNAWLREMRVVAYSQFLQAYRSVTLASMAEAFGVSSDFLDSELSRFVASGRLNCKVDKVNGVVETNRPDSRNSQYQSALKQGDILLGRIQKLTKIVSY